MSGGKALHLRHQVGIELVKLFLAVVIPISVPRGVPGISIFFSSQLLTHLRDARSIELHCGAASVGTGANLA
ncbi:hypothetical protein G6F22_021625 [Rhizopus arrhizus]|nr:hypothetical protein G6F22_021625 [Rhizopus arrhizus]KAG0919268.1 hypothetical protein G6F31_021181 [Rhizopus arrhizus]